MDQSRNCVTHSSRPARWFCWNCGRSFCEECVQPRGGHYICHECVDSDLDQVQWGLEAPEWPDIHWEAGFIRRLLAFLVDFSLIMILSIVFMWFVRRLMDPPASMTQTLFFTSVYLQLIVRDMLFPGGSPGKRWCGLYVWNNRRDEPLNVFDAVRRNLLFPVWILDILTIPFSPGYQRVGDHLANTVVYDEHPRRSEWSDLVWLGGLTGLNILAMIGVFSLWISIETTKRIPIEKTLENIKTDDKGVEQLLRRYKSRIQRLDIQKSGDSILVEAEVKTADAFFKNRERFRKILKSGGYRITTMGKPELVFRGENDVRFKLILEGTKKE
ncbi:MAG: RDD family protein [bacterium]